MDKIKKQINALPLSAEQKEIVEILLQKRDEKSISIDFSDVLEFLECGNRIEGIKRKGIAEIEQELSLLSGAKGAIFLIEMNENYILRELYNILDLIAQNIDEDAVEIFGNKFHTSNTPPKLTALFAHAD